jgi:AraC family transcriptional regulator
MTETIDVNLDEPRLETGAPLLIAGPRARYSTEMTAGIPMQWQQFHLLIPAVSGRVGGEAYGVCCDTDESGHFDYLCGVAVSSLADLPPGVSGVRVPAANYLVFRHRGHVSGIAATWRAIMEVGLPASGSRMADTPSFERYAADFDSTAGMGGAEIWIAIR